MEDSKLQLKLQRQINKNLLTLLKLQQGPAFIEDLLREVIEFRELTNFVENTQKGESATRLNRSFAYRQGQDEGGDTDDQET